VGNEILQLYAHDVKHYLQLQAELIMQLNKDPVCDRDLINRLRRINKKLLLETNSFQLFAKVDDLIINPIEVEFRSFVIDCCDEIRELFIAELKTITVKSASKEIVKEIFVKIDPAIFSAVIHNLANNALKYSFSNSEILINLECLADRVELSIKNAGEPITESEQCLIFDKNYRAANAQSQAGEGLGLYLCKKIVEAHGGQIALLSSDCDGTVFKITLFL
jgi:signal transduction histidine kinase